MKKLSKVVIDAKNAGIEQFRLLLQWFDQNEGMDFVDFKGVCPITNPGLLRLNIERMKYFFDWCEQNNYDPWLIKGDKISR